MDALADLDDALCMVHLFTNLPADKPIEAERIATATRLVREWQHIVVRSRALRKCFISVKGYYYQASFLGVPVTWTAPHRFALPIPDDVDCRILLTFLGEFAGHLLCRYEAARWRAGAEGNIAACCYCARTALMPRWPLRHPPISLPYVMRSLPMQSCMKFSSSSCCSSCMPSTAWPTRPDSTLRLTTTE